MSELRASLVSSHYLFGTEVEWAKASSVAENEKTGLLLELHEKHHPRCRISLLSELPAPWEILCLGDYLNASALSSVGDGGI